MASHPVSANLSERNWLIYCKHHKGRKGSFSKYLNARMDRDFTVNEEEHLMNVIRENSTKIEQLENQNEKMQRKLAISLKKHEQQ